MSGEGFVPPQDPEPLGPAALPISEPSVPAPISEPPPPLLGSWRRVYALVLIELGVSVLLLYALARWAS